MTDSARIPDPVVITGAELGDDSVPIDELQRRAHTYLRAHVQGQPIANGPTGQIIRMSRKGLKKTMSHAARREHVQSVVVLAQVLERAALIFTERNRDPIEARSVPLVHTLCSELVIGTTRYMVRLIVKQTNEGLRFYDHDLSAAMGRTSETIEPANSESAACLAKPGATDGEPTGSPSNLAPPPAMDSRGARHMARGREVKHTVCGALPSRRLARAVRGGSARRSAEILSDRGASQLIAITSLTTSG